MKRGLSNLTLLMKIKLITFILFFGIILTSCNNDVFVPRPEEVIPPEENPDSDPKPEITDSLILKSLTYIDGTLQVNSSLEDVRESKTTFINNGDKIIKVTILFDNYNHSIVKISNSTYYVLSWKEIQPEIEIPGFDARGVPGFYGTKIPFKFGTTSVRCQFLPGHTEQFDLPPFSKVTAMVSTRRKVVTAKAEIIYSHSDYPNSLQTGWADVSVSVPVEMTLSWGEVIPMP